MVNIVYVARPNGKRWKKRVLREEVKRLDVAYVGGGIPFPGCGVCGEDGDDIVTRLNVIGHLRGENWGLRTIRPRRGCTQVA